MGGEAEGEGGVLTDTALSVPSGWKLQETVVSHPVVLGESNVHVSLPWVPFTTKISLGVCTSRADILAVTEEEGTKFKSRIWQRYHVHIYQRKRGYWISEKLFTVWFLVFLTTVWEAFCLPGDRASLHSPG